MKNKKNMETIYFAEQSRPYDLYIKKIKLKNTLSRLKSYLQRIGKYNKEVNVKQLLKDLGKHGCTYAYITNVIINYFLEDNYYNDDKFKDSFGFSLKVNNSNNIDFNILMVDIFSALYKVEKLDVSKYEVYYFNDDEEAAKELVKNKNETQDTYLQIFNSGYISDGRTDDKKLIFKSRIPKNFVITGTRDEIVKNLFGVDKKDITEEEFKDLFDKNHMTYRENDFLPESKFSGIEPSHINYWVNYYLQKNNIDLKFESKEIPNNNASIYEFVSKVQEKSENGYSIGIDTSPNSQVSIYDPIFKDYVETSDKHRGHMMTFKRFDDNYNVVVESWGREFIISNKDIKKVCYQASKLEGATDKEIETKKAR